MSKFCLKKSIGKLAAHLDTKSNTGLISPIRLSMGGDLSGIGHLVCDVDGLGVYRKLTKGCGGKVAVAWAGRKQERRAPAPVA